MISELVSTLTDLLVDTDVHQASEYKRLAGPSGWSPSLESDSFQWMAALPASSLSLSPMSFWTDPPVISSSHTLETIGLGGMLFKHPDDFDYALHGF